MKKIILFLGFIIITGQFVLSQNFSQMSFKTVTGDSVLLSSFAGRKTLFFIVPLNQSDPIYSQLQAFKNRYLDTVRIVGVLSIEDGYQSASATAVQNLYSNMGIILTEGMYTKKSAGANQATLMKWLTHKNGNLHFDMDAGGTGQKFFVNETGRLYAVMPPQTQLLSPVIDRIVHSSSQ